LKASPDKVSVTLSQKQNKNKRIGDLAQVVEYMSSMHKTLDSIPSTEKKKVCFVMKIKIS
jgi:hypothetical protein